MLVISTREFRDKQTQYLNRAVSGESVVLKSRAGSFKIVPLSDDDSLMSKEDYFAMLDRSIQQAKEGKVTEYSLEELKIRLGL